MKLTHEQKEIERDRFEVLLSTTSGQEFDYSFSGDAYVDEILQAIWCGYLLCRENNMEIKLPPPSLYQMKRSFIDKQHVVKSLKIQGFTVATK